MPRLRSMRGMVPTCLGRSAPNTHRLWSLQRIIVAIASLDASQSIAVEIRSVQVTMIQQPWLDGGFSNRNPKTLSPRVIRLGTPHGPHGMGMPWWKVMWCEVGHEQLGMPRCRYGPGQQRLCCRQTTTRPPRGWPTAMPRFQHNI